MNWISVKDQLPNKPEVVIVSFNGDLEVIGLYTSNRWFVYWLNSPSEPPPHLGDITHWSHIVKPKKER